MSGPIVRKYGFPNFEKIFGERDIQHGIDDEPAATGVATIMQAKAPKAAKPKGEPKAKAAAKPRKK